MKNLCFLIFLFFVSSGFAQSLEGSWKGDLSVQGVTLPFVVHLKQVADGYEATADSPKQGAFGLAAKVKVVGDSLFVSTDFGAKVVGIRSNDSTITGNFHQGGVKIPLILKKDKVGAVVSEPLKRPQEPTAPFPYEEEDFVLEKDANTSIGGTITSPKNPGSYPAVVLISGSGQQNRDGELFGHKPLKLIADQLTRNGFVVLRFDDLGVGLSKGDVNNLTTLTQADDVEFLLTYLAKHAKVNPQRLGLIGHSEGGVIAPIIAARNKEVKYIVSLAGMAIRGKDLLLKQMADFGAADQSVEKKKFYGDLMTAASRADSGDPKPDMEKIINAYAETAADRLTQQDTAAISRFFIPWYITFINIDPAKYLKDVQIPLLALNGGKDVQVIAADNLAAFQQFLPKNKKNVFKTYPDLNHLFQKSSTGSVAEYSVIEETFSEQVIKDMLAWMKAL